MQRIYKLFFYIKLVIIAKQVLIYTSVTCFVTVKTYIQFNSVLAKDAGTIDIASEYVIEINSLINYLLHVTEWGGGCTS